MMDNQLVENYKVKNKALKLRLYPNTEQYQHFLKCFGCTRFVYNYYLAEKNNFYEKEIKPLGNDKKARNAAWKCFEETPLKELKEKYPWLREADLKSSIKDRTEFKLLCENTSSNYIKQRQKVAKLYEKVAWQRKDWLHKLSRQICDDYETVYVEDINLQTIASVLKHGKAIGDHGFGMLRQMIAYKGNLVKVNPKNTSKTCHVCGYTNPKVVVGVDEWNCPNCDSHHDRDINVALNILYKGNMLTQSIVGGEPAEITNTCRGPKSSMKQEVSQPSKVS